MKWPKRFKTSKTFLPESNRVINFEHFNDASLQPQNIQSN